MQLTLKSVLLAVALAYGAATVSALPQAGEFSLAERSEFNTFNAREVDDMQLFAREPRSKANANLRKAIANDPNAMRSILSDPNHSLHAAAQRRLGGIQKQNDAVLGKSMKTNRGLYRAALNDPKHPLHLAAKRNRAGYVNALRDPSHPGHAAAKERQLAAMRHNDGIVSGNPDKMREALSDKSHPLHRAAQRALSDPNHMGHQAARTADFHQALGDENHPQHAAAHAVLSQYNPGSQSVY